MPIFKEVTQTRYDEMMGALPPADWSARGFLVGEAWTHKRCTSTGREDSPAFAAFIQYRGKFWEATEPMTIGEFRELNLSRYVIRDDHLVPLV